MSRIPLLIVHPEATASALLAAVFRASGFEAVEAGDPAAAARGLDAGVALLLAAPAALGPLARALREHPEVPVILLVEAPDAGSAAEARRLGAVAVLKLPAPAAVLRATVIQALGLDGLPPASITPPRPRVAAAPGRDRGVATPAHRPAPPRPRAPAEPPTPPKARPPRFRKLKEAMQGPERRIIVRTLEALGWNRQETASALGIDRTTLHKKMRRYGLLEGGPAAGTGAVHPALRAPGSPRCATR